MIDIARNMKTVMASLLCLSLVIAVPSAYGYGGGGGGGSSSGGSSGGGSGGGNIGGGGGGMSAQKSHELAAAFKTAMPHSDSQAGKSFGGSSISKKSLSKVQTVFSGKGGESGSAVGKEGGMTEQHLDRLGKTIDMVATKRAKGAKAGTFCAVNLPYVTGTGEAGSAAGGVPSIAKRTKANTKSPGADQSLAKAQTAPSGPDKTPRAEFQSRLSAIAASVLQKQGKAMKQGETPQQMLERAVQAVAARNMISRPEYRETVQ